MKILNLLIFLFAFPALAITSPTQRRAVTKTGASCIPEATLLANIAACELEVEAHHCNELADDPEQAPFIRSCHDDSTLGDKVGQGILACPGAVVKSVADIPSSVADLITSPVQSVKDAAKGADQILGSNNICAEEMRGHCEKLYSDIVDNIPKKRFDAGADAYDNRKEYFIEEAKSLGLSESFIRAQSINVNTFPDFTTPASQRYREQLFAPKRFVDECIRDLRGNICEKAERKNILDLFEKMSVCYNSAYYSRMACQMAADTGISAAVGTVTGGIGALLLNRFPRLAAKLKPIISLIEKDRDRKIGASKIEKLDKQIDDILSKSLQATDNYRRNLRKLYGDLSGKVDDYWNQKDGMAYLQEARKKIDPSDTENLKLIDGYLEGYQKSITKLESELGGVIESPSAELQQMRQHAIARRQELSKLRVEKGLADLEKNGAKIEKVDCTTVNQINRTVGFESSPQIGCYKVTLEKGYKKGLCAAGTDFDGSDVSIAKLKTPKLGSWFSICEENADRFRTSDRISDVFALPATSRSSRIIRAEIPEGSVAYVGATSPAFDGLGGEFQIYLGQKRKNDVLGALKLDPLPDANDAARKILTWHPTPFSEGQRDALKQLFDCKKRGCTDAQLQSAADDYRAAVEKFKNGISDDEKLKLKTRLEQDEQQLQAYLEHLKEDRATKPKEIVPEIIKKQRAELSCPQDQSDLQGTDASPSGTVPRSSTSGVQQ